MTTSEFEWDVILVSTILYYSVVLVCCLDENNYSSMLCSKMLKYKDAWNITLFIRESAPTWV